MATHAFNGAPSADTSMFWGVVVVDGGWVVVVLGAVVVVVLGAVVVVVLGAVVVVLAVVGTDVASRVVVDC